MVPTTTHNSGSSTLEISKKDALHICSKCKKKNPKKCVIHDIEESQKDIIIAPDCMVSFGKVGGKSSPTHDKSSPTHEKKYNNISDLSSKNNTVQGGRTFTPNDKQGLADDSPTLNDIVQGVNKVRPPPMTKVRPPIGCTQGTGDLTLSLLDREILGYLQDDMHIRGIANNINVPRSTIRYRVRRMEEAGILISSNGVYGTKLYKISPDSPTQIGESLIHNEERKQAVDFSAHCMSFSYSIISGTQPKSKNSYHPRNWTGYVFKLGPHRIRSTPSSIIIDLNIVLEADTLINLGIKYMDISQPLVLNFAKEHNLKLGTPVISRKPHFETDDTGIGRVLSEVGSFKTRGMNLTFDTSRSSGDFESDFESAKAFDFTLNQLPGISAELKSKLSDLNQTTTEEFTKTQATLEQLSVDVNGLYVLLQMKHENDKLRADYKEMLDLMKSQIDPKQSPSDESSAKLTVSDPMQIYG